MKPKQNEQQPVGCVRFGSDDDDYDDDDDDDVLASQLPRHSEYRSSR